MADKLDTAIATAPGAPVKSLVIAQLLVLLALQTQQSQETEERAELVAVFIGLAFAMGGAIWALLGPNKAFEYFAGYLLEQSLSVDNLFVFVLVFDYFRTDSEGQEKVRPTHVASSACSLASVTQALYARACIYFNRRPF